MRKLRPRLCSMIFSVPSSPHHNQEFEIEYIRMQIRIETATSKFIQSHRMSQWRQDEQTMEEQEGKKYNQR